MTGTSRDNARMDSAENALRQEHRENRYRCGDLLAPVNVDAEIERFQKHLDRCCETEREKMKAGLAKIVSELSPKI